MNKRITNTHTSTPLSTQKRITDTTPNALDTALSTTSEPSATILSLLSAMTPEQRAAFGSLMAPQASAAPAVRPPVLKPQSAPFIQDLEVQVRNELEKLGKVKLRILVSRFGYGLLAALAKWGGEAEVTPQMVAAHIHAPLAKISVGEEFLLGDAKRFRDVLAGFHTAYRRHLGGMAAIVVPNTATSEQAEAIRLRNAAVQMLRDMIDAALASTEAGTLGATGRKRFTDAFVQYVEALGATNENRFRVIVANLAGANGETIESFDTPYSVKTAKVVEPEALKDGDAPEAGDKAPTEGGEAPEGDSPQGDEPKALDAPRVAEPKALDTAGTGVSALPMNTLLLSVKATLDTVLALADAEAQRVALRALEGLEAEVHAAVAALRATLAKGAKAAKQPATTLPPLPSEAPKASGKGKPGGPASVSEKRDMAVQEQTLMAAKLGEALAAKAATEGGNIPAAAVAADVAKRKNAKANSRKAR